MIHTLTQFVMGSLSINAIIEVNFPQLICPARSFVLRWNRAAVTCIRFVTGICLTKINNSNPSIFSRRGRRSRIKCLIVLRWMSYDMTATWGKVGHGIIAIHVYWCTMTRWRRMGDRLREMKWRGWIIPNLRTTLSIVRGTHIRTARKKRGGRCERRWD